MHYKGHFYKTYEELQQDIETRKEEMFVCLGNKQMDELARLYFENFAMLKHMKTCQARAEALMSLHADIGDLVDKFQSYLLKVEALKQSLYAQEAVNDVLKEHEMMGTILKYFPAYKPFKMRKLRRYLGRKEAFDAVMKLQGVGVVFYDIKWGKIYLTDYGRHILQIML